MKRRIQNAVKLQTAQLTFCVLQLLRFDNSMVTFHSFEMKNYKAKLTNDHIQNICVLALKNVKGNSIAIS